MSNISWRHHYLPIFYLKGFTNQLNKFLIYDVQQKRFIKNGKEFSPTSYFFEKDSNTFIKDEDKNDFLEKKYYTPFDDKASNLFELINSSNADNRFSVSEDDMPLLQSFVNLMYWRLPHRKAEIDELLENNELNFFGLSIQNLDGTKNVETKKKEEELKKDNEFKKGFRFYMSLFDTMRMIDCRTPLHIQPFFNALPLVCSDNPVIYRNSKPNIFEDDFIFPITGNKLFIRTENTSKLTLDFKILIDTLTFKQTVKYVSFTDKRYPELLNEFYNKHFNSIDELRQKVFESLKNGT